MDGLSGVAFRNPSAARPCFVKGGDLKIYNKENLVALRIATSGRLVREDFENDDWECAQPVSNADPHLVKKARVRLLVDVTSSKCECEFNTAFPVD